MVEGATVVLPLNEFDGMRRGSEEFQRLAIRIAACFEYEFKDYGEPEKCKSCKKENPNCIKCKVFKETPPWEEILTVDVERLINVAKQYAFYDKGIEAGIGEATIVIKERGADK